MFFCGGLRRSLRFGVLSFLLSLGLGLRGRAVHLLGVVENETRPNHAGHEHPEEREKGRSDEDLEHAGDAPAPERRAAKGRDVGFEFGVPRRVSGTRSGVGAGADVGLGCGVSTGHGGNGGKSCRRFAGGKSG